MRNINNDELKVILENHWKWLCEESDGKRANLSGADLRGANLRRAKLRRANLRRANLSVADLRGADLRGADLSEAYLYMADLRGANLREADLSDCKIDYPIACPEKGSFIAFKKSRDSKHIIELEILADALRCSATSRKCRCSKARVLSITTLDGENDGITEIESHYDNSFIYKIGETVEVPDFDENRWNECSTGIHFFITRQEAVDYLL